jgi:hypothetical protein
MAVATRRPWVRTALTFVAFPVMFVAIGALVSLAGTTTVFWGAYAFGGVVFGAVVRRWWAVALPLLWGGGYVGVLRLVDLARHTCSVCGSDDDWGNYPLIILVLLAAPMAAAILVGVVTGKFASALQRRRCRRVV